MPKKPDAWTRFMSRFVGGRDRLEEKEQHTEDVIAHAETVRRAADEIMRLEYAEAEGRYRHRRGS